MFVLMTEFVLRRLNALVGFHDGDGIFVPGTMTIDRVMYFKQMLTNTSVGCIVCPVLSNVYYNGHIDVVTTGWHDTERSNDMSSCVCLHVTQLS